VNIPECTFLNPSDMGHLLPWPLDAVKRLRKLHKVMFVMPAALEIGRIMVQGQPLHKIIETPFHPIAGRGSAHLSSKL
jgi:hypothetical protein